VQIFGTALKAWWDDDASRLGAALAYYTLFAIAPPSHPWRTFLANHVGQIMAADFFVVPTVTYRLSFVLVILAHHRRRIVHVAVTDHPTGVDGPATPQCLSRGPRAAVPAARPRCRIHATRRSRRGETREIVEGKWLLR
jgi:hypothetical protein